MQRRAPQLAPADGGQGELFGDDYALRDAADGEPVFLTADSEPRLRSRRGRATRRARVNRERLAA